MGLAAPFSRTPHPFSGLRALILRPPGYNDSPVSRDARINTSHYTITVFVSITFIRIRPYRPTYSVLLFAANFSKLNICGSGRVLGENFGVVGLVESGRVNIFGPKSISDCTIPSLLSHENETRGDNSRRLQFPLVVRLHLYSTCAK